MHLKRLLLRNFRNYAQAEISFSPSTNLILGDNGQGKTNLLEAIHFISTGRSFRTKIFSNLILVGEKYFYLEAEFVKDGVTQTIKVYYDDKTKKVEHNATQCPTLASLLGILPSVLLSPDDRSLITGAPAERRRFLDMHIAQIDPVYIHHLARYFRAMKQRNQLLRSSSETAIDAWEQMMAESACYLILKRRQMVRELQAPCSEWIENLSCGRDRLELNYHSSVALPEEGVKPHHFQQVWQEMRAKEMAMGLTLAGPHRDDLLFHLSDHPAKVFSSEGQKRSCVAALRFAQWMHIEQLKGCPPLLGIDDFGIQLDEGRQMQLKTHLLKFRQVFLTSPFALNSEIPCHILTVDKGMITDASSRQLPAGIP